MTDNQPNPSYQDILDKYAESINSKEDHQIPEEKIKPEPELEPINPPESILTPEEEEVIKSQPPVEAEETPLNPPEAVLNPPQIEAPPTPEAINSPPVAEAIISPPPQIELPPESSEISPKKPNHFFKYLFFFSLIIFIVVLVLVVISFLNSQKPVSNSRDIPQNNFSPTSLPTDFCELNNQQYLVGATFTADDGCNTCTCGEDLTVTCTTNTCDLTPTTSATTSGAPTKSATSSAISELKIISSIPVLNEGTIDYKDTIKAQEPLSKLSVTFNNSMDLTSFNSNTFYLLQGIDDKVSGKFSTDSTTKSVIFTFDKPISKSQLSQTLRLTVVIDGIKDQKGNIFSKSSYNIDL